MEFDEVLRLANEAFSQQTQKSLNNLQTEVLRGAWQRQRYGEIAIRVGYSENYLQQDVGYNLWRGLSRSLGEKVGIKNFRSVMERRFSTLPSQRVIAPTPPPVSPNLPVEESDISLSGESDDRFLTEESDDFWQPMRRRPPDLKDAPGISQFCGRDRTRQELKDLIAFDGYRLLCIYGVGGVGKTALALKLAQELEHQFEGVIYRSLNPPFEIEQLEADLIHYLGNGSPSGTESPDLITCLRKHRCLVILDGWEALLRDKVHDGSYLPEYGDYHDLLLRIGRTNAIQSCFIITSREKPTAVEILGVETEHTCSHELQGFGETSGQRFLALKRLTADQESDRRELLNRYASNPQILNLVATRIRGFGGNITRYLERLFQKTSDRNLPDELLLASDQIISRKIPESERQRLKKQQSDLQALWYTRTDKLTRLRQAFVIETSAATKFQLEQEIQSEEEEIKLLETQLSEIEEDLYRGADFSTVRISTQNGSFAGEIGELLNGQLQRLSESENLVVNCLAKYQGYPKFADLQQALVQKISDYELVEVLHSLSRRSLIMLRQEVYELHPLFRRYLIS